MKRDFTKFLDISEKECRQLLTRARDLKRLRKSGKEHKTLLGKSLAMIFEKASTRTRISFEVGMYELGGQGIFLSPGDTQIGRGEPIKDTARVLERYTDAIMIRTYSQDIVEELAKWASIPVINGLSDLYHPCQILADLFTIQEYKGDFEGRKIAYIGDGNNVANSLLLAASLTGMNFRIAAPPGYNIQEGILEVARKNAGDSGGEVMCTEDPKAAVDQADVLYTDVWTSMGQEEEAEARRQAFANYTVDDELLSLAREDAILMHPLPAHRGQEVSEDILDCLQSVVFDQAENRLHIQKVILGRLLGSMGFPLIGHR